MTTLTKISPSIRSGERWHDEGGLPIRCFGGNLLWDESSGRHYWYGQHYDGPTFPSPQISQIGGVAYDHAATRGVACYSSADLVSWRFEGDVLPSLTDATNDLWHDGVINRPKVVYLPANGTYVMWFHSDLPTYDIAMTGCAVATAPTGPFHYLGRVRPNGSESRDMGLFQDVDGSTWHIHTSERNDTLHLAELTGDGLSFTGRAHRILIGAKREAPALFRHDGWYWLITSPCLGWAQGSATVARAHSLAGPWEDLGELCVGPGSDTSFASQPTWVQPVPGRPGEFIYLGDRWDPTHLSDSRHVWLPLRFVGGRPQVRWSAAWDMPR